MRALLLTLLAAAALAALLFLGGRGRRSAERPGPALAAAPATEASPLVPATTVDSAETARLPLRAAEEAAAEPAADLGGAELLVRFRDRASGEPMACAVELWQLDVPETERFSAGDRKAADATVPEAGLAFRGLPAGRYRFVCHGQWRGVDDPPAFLVAPPRTELVLELERPREVVVAVVLFDARGEVAPMMPRYDGFEPLPHARPSWILPRRAKEPATALGAGSGGRSVTLRYPADVLHFPQRLGTFREADRLRHTKPRYRWHVAGGDTRHESVVRDGFDDLVFLSEEVDAALPRREYVGVALPPTFFDACFLLPDGRTAAEAGASLHVDSALVRSTPSSPWDHWRDVPVEVRAELEGYRRAELEYRLVDGPPEALEPVVLVPDETELRPRPRR